MNFTYFEQITKDNIDSNLEGVFFQEDFHKCSYELFLLQDKPRLNNVDLEKFYIYLFKKHKYFNPVNREIVIDILDDYDVVNNLLIEMNNFKIKSFEIIDTHNIDNLEYYKNELLKYDNLYTQKPTYIDGKNKSIHHISMLCYNYINDYNKISSDNN
jgi:hypothetical protein